MCTKWQTIIWAKWPIVFSLSSLLLFASFSFKSKNLKHDFHSSLAEVQYDEEKKLFEVSLRVFADDLENAVKKFENEAFVLKMSSKAQPDVQSYVRKHFQIRNRGKLLNEYNFIGAEVEVDVVWLYFTVGEKVRKKDLEIRYSIFHDLFSDQFNILNYKEGGEKHSALYKVGDSFKMMEI